MRKNYKAGFGLTEAVIAVVLFSSIVISAITVMQSLASGIASDSLFVKTSEERNNILLQVNKIIKNSETAISSYSFSEILGPDSNFIKDGKRVFLEEKFRRELKSILISNGIILNNGKITGVVDEKSNKGTPVYDLSKEPEMLQKLENEKICNGTIDIGGNKSCNIRNTISDIDENHKVIVAKNKGVVYILFIAQGNLNILTYSIDSSLSSSSILNYGASIINNNQVYNSDIKIFKFLISGDSNNYTFGVIDDLSDSKVTKDSKNVQIKACNLEYIGNDILTERLFCID